jgi:hypothetical protein
MLYAIIISFLIFTQGNRPGTQTIETWGLYIAFLFPIIQTVVQYLKMRTLVRGLFPGT